MVDDTAVRLSRLDRLILLLLMTGATNLHYADIVRLIGMIGWTLLRLRLDRLQQIGWVTAVPTNPNRGPAYRLTAKGRYYGAWALGLRFEDDE